MGGPNGNFFRGARGVLDLAFALIAAIILLVIGLAALAQPPKAGAQPPKAEARAPKTAAGGDGARNSSHAAHKLLVGYFPQWGLYNDPPYTVKDLVASGGAGMLDQIDYAQGFVTGGRCSVADPNADLNTAFTAQNSVDGTADPPDTPGTPVLRGNFHQLQELKRRYPKLKILISLEGRAFDFAADAAPDARAAFVASCIDLFLKGNIAPGVQAPGLFDGIDIDWEYPRGDAAANYIPLLEEFRRQMDALRPGLRLTVALGPSPRMYDGADGAAIGRTVDLAGLMTYDFTGPWDRTTGFLAPLASDRGGSVQRSVEEWTAAGVPADKLLVGIPFYAYGWHQVANDNASNHGLGQSGMPIRGDHPYRSIASLIPDGTPPTDADPPSPATRAAQSGPAVAPGGDPPDSARPFAGPAAAPNPAKTAASGPVSDPPASANNAAIDPPSPAPAAAQPAAHTDNAPPAPLVLYRDPASQAPWLFNGDSFWTYEDAASIRAKAAFASSHDLAGFMVWELSDDTPKATLLHAAHDALASDITTVHR